MIYFIQERDGGLIKIGFTRRMTRRVKAYSTHASAEHVVLGVMVGGRSEERAIHERFSSLRQKGEWFLPGDDLLRFIDDNAVEWDGTDDGPSHPTTVTVRIRKDLHKMARVVAAFTDQETDDVVEALVRPGINTLYREELAKAVVESEGL